MSRVSPAPKELLRQWSSDSRISRAGRGQPKSTLTRWFLERTMGQGGRIKRIMIVAVARKLAIALWRFLEHGLVPQGAILSSK